MNIAKSLIAFAIGGLIYGLIELAWRGHTHISMFIAGGICFFIIDLISQRLARLGLIVQMLLCGLAITTVEFSVGVIVNLWLDLKVWDYSGMPGNILGQICPQFMLLWLGLSFPAMFLANGMRAVLFGDEPAKMQLLPMTKMNESAV